MTQPSEGVEVCPECQGRLEYDPGEPWEGPSWGCTSCGIEVDAPPTSCPWDNWKPSKDMS